MLKNCSTLAVSIPINLNIKLGFVYVNGARETYFVDTLRRHMVANCPETERLNNYKILMICKYLS